MHVQLLKYIWHPSGIASDFNQLSTNTQRNFIFHNKSMYFHCILVLLVLSWKLYFFIKNWKVGRNHGFYKSLVDFKIFFNLVDNSSNGFIDTLFLKSYNSEFLPFRHLELEVMKISSFSWLKNCNKFGKFQCISKSHFL